MYGAAAGVLGYLLGSFPFGYLFGRLKGVDLRNHGSGATGGTNVGRTLGLRLGMATAVLDLLKGVAAVWLGRQIAGEWGLAAAGLLAMVGHAYPVWLSFKGGKSVATGGGGFLLLYPGLVGLGVAGMVATVWPTRFVSLGSLVAATIICVGATLIGPLPVKLWAIGAWLLVFWRHRSNIARLLAGTERKLGRRV